ncbi:MAG: DedA family protein [Candidatus Levyibacteriota bacterium]
MIFSLDQVIQWLSVYKYIILFPVMVIEGPIVTIIAGFLSSLKLLNPILVYLVVVAADVIGDFIYYAIGRWGRERFIDRWGKYIGLSTSKIEKLEGHFERHTKKTLIFGKISHAFGAPILVAAGIVKMPLWGFLWFNFWVTLPKSFIFLMIGFYFGQAYVGLSKYLDYFSIGLLVAAVIIIFSYYAYNRLKIKFYKFITKLKEINIFKVK